ncbi:hypothetical protein CYMTET_15190 [Cymbomonas tetramitiformis]|uniref:Magnesium-protoporphyrin IX methyltransferase C-terminal domain-containing protein n=1 Tax=Cymbomonas tetramitiformis TaxID=36881 RepID=A0AAE0GEZ8_9CHLO|nr:hypothetical protein CYMTET_15190 [Cymbomonas tetramitiformis]
MGKKSTTASKVSLPSALAYSASASLIAATQAEAVTNEITQAVNPVISGLADAGNGLPLAVGSAAAIAGLAFLLATTDPEKRRTDMATEAGGDEMKSVKDYFNTVGFERWEKIYGETEEVNKVQLDIRTGHAKTVSKVINWLKEDGELSKGITVCDAGCGTGSLSIPLALEGASINASDISSAMAGEAEKRCQAALEAAGTTPAVAPKFEANDLESISGKYHTVTCLDVMIHYPQDKADAMITHLASLADDRLIISFAPKTLAYSILKRIGELFPGPSKATRAYLHYEEDVEKALNAAGWKVCRREMTATSFYFSRLLEAKRA